MAKSQRMLHGQFGSVSYNSGVMDAGASESAPNAETAMFNNVAGNYMAVPRHDDTFYADSTLMPNNVRNKAHFMTYQYVDLRDMITEKQCLDDITINVQRLYDNPWPGGTYNMAPTQAIQEAFIVLLGKMDFKAIEQASPPELVAIDELVNSGFMPTRYDTGAHLDNGLPFQVLYREVRRYMSDPSQQATSPNMMGTQAGPGGNPATPTRWTGNLSLIDRTVGGYPNLVVGPGITVIRVWSVYPAKRVVQDQTGGAPGDASANELVNLRSFVNLTTSPLQWNITGTQRKLTDAEQAKWYTNILLSQED